MHVEDGKPAWQSEPAFLHHYRATIEVAVRDILGTAAMDASQPLMEAGLDSLGMPAASLQLMGCTCHCLHISNQQSSNQLLYAQVLWSCAMR
jgi:hypothetical protein